MEAVRIAQFRVTPERREEALDNIEHVLIPCMEAFPGFRRGYWLLGADADTAVAVTFWESEEARSAFGTSIQAEMEASGALTGTVIHDLPLVATARGAVPGRPAGAMLHAYPARTTLPALELARAKRFYAETLGLSAVEESPGGVVFRCGAGGEAAATPGWAETATFLVFPSANPVRGGHTQMGFLVDDVRSVVTALRERGVVFEDYDLPGLRTQDGVAPILDGRGAAAWFKDTEGNIIGLVHFEH